MEHNDEKLRRAAERKAELESLLLHMEDQQKELEPQVFSLKITAHNEQVEADQWEKSRTKGLLLGLLGKREARVERELREAQNAGQQYALAAARLDALKRQMEAAKVELAELSDCDEAYWVAIRESVDPATMADLSELEKQHGLLHETSTLLTVTRSGIEDVMEKLHQAEKASSGLRHQGAMTASAFGHQKAAQQAFNAWRKELCRLELLLRQVGVQENMELDELRGVETNYLEELVAENTVSHRVNRITILLRRVTWKLDAIWPKLARMEREHSIALQQARLDVRSKR